MDGLAVVDGVVMRAEEATVPATDPGLLLGWTVFETLALPADAARIDAHLARLQASAAHMLVPFPGEASLRSDLARVAAAMPAARVRVTLTRGGHRVIVATLPDPTRWGHVVRCVRGPHRDEPFVGGRPKHGSRAAWAVAVARSGVDDVMLVDGDGRFTEATTAGIVAVCGGVVFTAPDDGRVLPSTTVAEVVAAAEAEGVPVVRQGAPAAGPWDGLYLASATRGLAPVVSLDGVALPVGEPVGLALHRGLRPA